MTPESLDTAIEVMKEEANHANNVRIWGQINRLQEKIDKLKLQLIE